MQLQKTIEVNELLSVYGAMLTEKQLDIMQKYYFYDNSLSEIAEQAKITRQAVSDLLNRVVKTLYNYEKRLGFLSKKTEISKKLNSILENTASKKIKNKVNEVKFILEG